MLPSGWPPAGSPNYVTSAKIKKQYSSQFVLYESLFDQFLLEYISDQNFVVVLSSPNLAC